jgi:Tol biopolymer transport system component
LLEFDRDGRLSETLPLTDGTALRWAPTVSPDGRWIAYAEQSRGSSDLYRIPLEGGAAERITHGAQPLPPSQIAWSPDGTRLAYHSSDAAGARLWVADVATGARRRLSGSEPGAVRGHLAWAPGRLLAYHNVAHDNIHLLDPESGVERTLVPESEPGWFFAPRYGPDGEQLAVAWQRNESGDHGIWIFDLHDSPPRRLTSRWTWPVGWSADGAHVYAWHHLEPDLVRISTAGEVEVLPLPELPPGYLLSECTPAGPLRPRAFVCTQSLTISDIWILKPRPGS